MRWVNRRRPRHDSCARVRRGLCDRDVAGRGRQRQRAVTSDGAGGDEWRALRQQILDADHLCVGHAHVDWSPLQPPSGCSSASTAFSERPTAAVTWYHLTEWRSSPSSAIEHGAYHVAAELIQGLRVPFPFISSTRRPTGAMPVVGRGVTNQVRPVPPAIQWWRCEPIEREVLSARVRARQLS
jgi:hypothetical protein